MMPITIFRIIWPFVRGYATRKAAERAAVYLQKRRERQLKKSNGPEEFITPEQELICPPSSKSFSTADAIWYTLSGVLMGSAMGFMLTQIFRQED